MKQIVVIIGASQFANYVQNIFQHPAAKSTPYAEEIIGDHQCGFHATGRLLIIYSVFVIYLRKDGNTKKQGISSSYTER